MRKVVLFLVLVVALPIVILLLLRGDTHSPSPSMSLLPSRHLLEIRSDYRRGNLLETGRPIELLARLPAGANLVFSYGIPTSEWKAASEPFTLSVTVEGNGKRSEEKEQLRPSTAREDRSWKEWNMDLSAYENEEVRIRFALTSTGSSARAYVANEKLLNPAFEIQKPNVVLIIIDTLRKDHVSSYGYERMTTPVLDEFAGRSAVFKNAFSTAPLTVPSVTSIMTSTYVSQHGVPNNRAAFRKDRPTLAALMKKAGYTTAAFIGNAVLRTNRNLNEGFDVYNAFLPGSEINRRLPERGAAQLTAAAASWLRSHAQERFFLWLHYQDPHAPYTPPEPWDKHFPPSASPQPLSLVEDYTGKGGIPDYAKLPGIFDAGTYIARYDGEIAYADAQVGSIVNLLSQLGLDDRTMVIITSDHGESLGENNHYFAHGHNVTAELTDVPLLIAGPGLRQGSYDHTVSLIDLAPTILKYCKIAVPTGFAGKNLFEPQPQRAVFSEQPARRWAWIREEGRYIYDRTGERIYPERNPLWEEGAGAVRNWIADHISSGVVFAFSSGNFEGATITSSEPIRSAYLAGSENDRIRIEDRAVHLQLQSATGEVDYVFVDAVAAAQLTVRDVSVRAADGKTLSSEFRIDSLPESKTLPGPKDFSDRSAIVVRMAGEESRIPLSAEEQEELKSIGYVGD